MKPLTRQVRVNFEHLLGPRNLTGKIKQKTEEGVKEGVVLTM